MVERRKVKLSDFLDLIVQRASEGWTDKRIAAEIHQISGIRWCKTSIGRVRLENNVKCGVDLSLDYHGDCCRECKKRKRNAARGLCKRCFAEPQIRCKYGGPKRLILCETHVEEPVHVEEPEQEPEPTDAMPGTKAKIEVLRQRFEAGEQLWNRRDAYDND